MPTISLVMIVRNEEDNLANCLNSIKGEVDEIVIIDTGSTDKSLEIAKKYSDKVFYYAWHDDFSAARNFGLSKAAGEWILSLDADEQLDIQQGTLKEALASNANAAAIFLPLFNCQSDTTHEFTRSNVLRLFLNKSEYKFQGSIHERINIQNTDLLGYSDAPVIWHKVNHGKLRQKKRSRNIKLLNKVLRSNKDSAFYTYYLGVEWLGLGQMRKAISCFKTACDDLPDTQIMFKSRAIRNLILCLKITGQINEALALCQEACKRYPIYADVHFDKGTVLEDLGHLKQAILCFKTAIDLGEPPPVYCHDNGVKSYLAYYHLGLCYEGLGDLKQAEDFYGIALHDNQDYGFSLQSLFLLKIRTIAAENVFEYFKALGCFARMQQSKILAKLFFDAGMPDLAAMCFKEIAVTGMTDTCNYVRCLVFSGEYENALNIIATTKTNNVIANADLETHEIIALILIKDYRTAKKLTLNMWRNSEKRSRALALLSLLSYFDCQGTLIQPEKSRESEFIKTLLCIAECCLRSQPFENLNCYKELYLAAVAIVKQLSTDSKLALMNYFAAKADALRRMLEYTNGPARRLLL